MTDPVFPVPMEILNASLEFNDFDAGETLEPEAGLRIKTISLNHEIPVTGYRVEWNGKSICYVSDLIAGAGGDEDAALSLLDGADLAVVNTADNSPGSSDWRDAVRLCETAGVATCATFSHHPDHDDAALDEIAIEAEKRRPGTVVAREGMTLSV
jgi:phosphoribosyl 1,2-cyclic phosphodiesterase